MPLWTILTKWPAPVGPQCRYPCSAGPGSPCLPGVRARRIDTRRDGSENRIQVFHDVFLAADHQTEAALLAEHAAAGAAIDVMDAPGVERFRPEDIVAVVAVAAVDDDVAGIHARGQILDGLARHRGGNHDPDCAGFGQLRHQFIHRGRTLNVAASEFLHCGGIHIVNNTTVTILAQTPHQAGAHSSQSDHA